MKTIKVTPIKNYRGGALNVPTFDDSGSVKTKALLKPNGEPILDNKGKEVTENVFVEADVVTLLDYGMIDFPREKWTMKHIAEATKLIQALSHVKETGSDELPLEDSTYKWLISVLTDDAIGVPMFGLNLPNVLTALGADIADA